MGTDSEEPNRREDAGRVPATNGNHHQITGLNFDAAGNQTNDGSGLTFTYDAENRIVATGGVTYAYDGDGKRVKKDQASGSTYDKLYWFGAGSDTLTETNLSGTATADFIFFGGKRTARLDVASGTIHYYFSDHLGSASVVTNATGTTIEEESDYYPWGRERVVVDLLPDQNYKFTGKERDLETGLDYFGARYYSSGFGRFLTPDWADAPTAVPYADFGNPQSLNLYTYVGNNPITRFDVDGHDGDSVTESLRRVAENVGESMIRTRDAVVNGYKEAGKAVGAVIGEVGAGVGEVVGGIAAGNEDLAMKGVNRIGATVAPMIALGVAATSEAAVATRATAGATSRLAQDVAVNPKAPPPLELSRPVGPSAGQNVAAQADVRAAQAAGAKDIRINQQQINAAGQRVGINRPDLQYTEKGTRVYTEYGKSGSTRELAHERRIQANDPKGKVKLKGVD